MKNNIILLILGLAIGMLIMINQVCKQKDSMIRLLMNNNKVETVKSMPNLPKIEDLK